MNRFANGESLKSTLRGGTRYVWRAIRLPLAWLLIAVGVLGCILPIIPGVPFLVLGTAIVGRRTWIIRWTYVNFRVMLRLWARHPHPSIRGFGRFVHGAAQELSRQIRRFVWDRAARRRVTVSFGDN